VTDRWDVLVVGAGPAGATTALLLARAGASVLLVDRARFPRDKACSEYLSPATTEILERLGGGILDAVEGAAHAKLYGMKVVAPCGAAMCGRFRGGPRPYSFALPRTTFDTILVAAAAREGAIVREGLTVESVVFDGNTAAGVFARSGNGKRETYRSRVVVGADGLRSVVARRLGLIRSSPPRRVAFTAHVADVAGMDGVGELHVSKRGYVGLGAVGGGVTTVALVVPLAAVRRSRSEGRDFRRDFSPSSSDSPGSRDGSTPADWFATFWPPVRSRSGRAPPSRQAGEPCSLAMQRISLTRLRARGSTARCAAQNSPPPVSSPRLRAGSVNPFRLRPCGRTCSPGGASSSESGCSSDSSGSASGGRRSPTAWCAAWRGGRTSRIFW